MNESDRREVNLVNVHLADHKEPHFDGTSVQDEKETWGKLF